MKLNILVVFATFSLLPRIISNPIDFDNGLSQITEPTTSDLSLYDIVEAQGLGIGKLGSIAKGEIGKVGKIGKKVARKAAKKAIIVQLELISKSLGIIQDIRDLKLDDEDQEDDEDSKFDAITEKLLTEVVIGLKNSGIIEPILKFSLTDDQIRQSLIDFTIQLLKADVIPWEDIFNALRDSGLAIEVIKFAVTDPETRQGEIDLVLELLPQLLDEGVIDWKNLLKTLLDHIPKQINWKDVVDDINKHIPSNITLPLPHVEIPKLIPLPHFNITLPHIEVPKSGTDTTPNVIVTL